MLQQAMTGSQIYSKRIPLPPGTYRLNIVAKDTVGNTANTYEVALNVPHYDEDQLGSSSVILADELERVPTNSIGDRPVCHSQLEGSSAHQRHIQAGRNHGHLYGVLQLRHG